MTQLIPTLTTMSLLDYLDSLSAENLSADLDSGGASGMFVFGQKLISADLSTGDGFGESVIFDNNAIYVGVPGEDSALVVTPTLPTQIESTVDLYEVDHATWGSNGWTPLQRYGVWPTDATHNDAGDEHTITRVINVTEPLDVGITCAVDGEMLILLDDVPIMTLATQNNSSTAMVNLTSGTHTLKFMVTNGVAATAERRTANSSGLFTSLIISSVYVTTADGEGYYWITDHNRLYSSRNGIQWQPHTEFDPLLSYTLVDRGTDILVRSSLTALYALAYDGSTLTPLQVEQIGGEVWAGCMAVKSPTSQIVGCGDGLLLVANSNSGGFRINRNLSLDPRWGRSYVTLVGWNGTEYIACSSTGIAFSSDGILWTIPVIHTDNPWGQVAGGSAISLKWFNDMWVISDDTGISVITTSPINATEQSVTGGVSDQLDSRYITRIHTLASSHLTPLIVVGDRLITAATSLTQSPGPAQLLSSTDGITWISVEMAEVHKPGMLLSNIVANNTGSTLVAFVGAFVALSYDAGESWEWAADPCGFGVAIYPWQSTVPLWDTRTYKLAATLAYFPGAAPNALNTSTLDETSDEIPTDSGSIESITVGSKDANIGQVAVFSDITGAGAWTVASQQKPGVDPGAINSVFLFNTVTNSKVETLDFIDPAKGRILGVVEQAIDYKTCFDPAYYNIGITTRVQPAICWGPDQVGKIWWDLSTVAWLDYEQGEFAYRSANWGKLFPGSDIRLYVWAESDMLPSQFLKTSETRMPRDFNDIEYVEMSTVDKVTGVMQTRYFYWVTDISSNAAAVKDGLSLDDMKRMIESPQTSGIPYAAFVSPSTVGMWNISDRLVANDVALHVSYDVNKNDSLIHSEFQLVQEGSSISEIPKNIITKIIDSLCGADTAGNIVPDPTLSAAERYGIGFRPRQGVFLDAKSALRMFITAANKLFVARPLLPSITADSALYSAEVAPSPHAGEYINTVPDVITLGYLELSEYAVADKVLVENDQDLDGWAIYSLSESKQWVRVQRQAYNTTKFWSIVDWYATPTYAALTKFSYVVDMDYEVQSLPLVPGHTVKVKDTGGGKFRIYTVDDTGALQIVGVQAATISISERLWLLQPAHEVRFVISALLIIFEQEKVLNDSFFALVRFALSEQKAVDWVFKTSFITVLHKIRNLAQYATYQKDNQDFVREFINEVKPYRTKIREYLLSYSAAETWDGVVSDFDLPGYYDVDFNRFRSPSGEHNKDAELYDLEENKQWLMHHTYYIGSIEVIHGGSGYSLAPQVDLIGGGGGAGATAYAQVSNGVVRRVIVSIPGTGYYTAPVVKIIGVTGSGASAIARLANDTTRKISTTIKFDRTTYDSSMIDWEPNTLYKPGTILTYSGVVYKVQTLFQSSTEFDANYMTLVDAATMANANDRTMGFYQPKAGMVTRDLAQIFTGIEYPGMKLQGASFNNTQEMENGSDGSEQLSTDVLDEVITSVYRDIALGTRPEDIDIQGGAYVDTYSSHSPEELIPGIIFDTLDMQVFTRPAVPDLANAATGADIRVFSFAGNNSQRLFDVKIDNFRANSCIVYTLNLGNLREIVDYTYDVETGVVDLLVAPTSTDMVYVYLMKTVGNNCIYSETFVADGISQMIAIPHVDARLITDSAILLNGTRIYEYDIESVGTSSTIRFATAQPPTAHIHVYLFSGVTGEHAFSDMTTQYVKIDAASPKEITLSNTLRYAGPLDTSLVVELNNSRLRPSDNRYYAGNGVIASFPVPTTGDMVPTIADISVWVNGLRKFENIEYTFEWVQLVSGVTCLCVTFGVIPAQTDTVVISLSTFAEFIIVDSNTLRLKSDLPIADSSELKIVSFSTHDSLKMQTRVFTGAAGLRYDFSESDPTVGDIPLSFNDSMSTLSTMNEGLGFSMMEWDNSPYDSQDFVSPLTVDTLAAIDRFDSALDSNYVWVTLNGRRLLPNYEFMMTEKNMIVLAPELQVRETDYIVITTFALPEFNEIIGYRIFKNMLNEVSYLRISGENSTELAAVLGMLDTEIVIANARSLPNPNPELAQPGVVFINGERITYYSIDYARNTLGQLRRGTGGTGAAVHPTGSKVVDASSVHTIPDSAAPRWNTTGLSLMNSDTVQANFIKSKPSFNPA